MAKKRIMALALVIVALALTVTGVVIAATDSNPGSLKKDPLVLNGYPPTSVELAVSVSTGHGVAVNADVNVNFKTGRIAALVRVPLVITTASVNLILANDRLYARSAAVANGPWYQTTYATPNLFGASLEFTKPDLDLIAGFHKEVTSSGYSTTYVFTRNDVPLRSVFGSNSAYSRLGSIRWSITVGSQGEVTASTVVEKTPHATTDLSVSVLSYNESAHIEIPPSTSGNSVSALRIENLLKDVNFSSLLVPQSLTSLSRASVS